MSRQGDKAYSPKPVRTALESLPMMLVLLPTLIWALAWVIPPETTTTFFAVPETAAVNSAKEETVVVVPPDPPVVPPFSLA